MNLVPDLRLLCEGQMRSVSNAGAVAGTEGAHINGRDLHYAPRAGATVRHRHGREGSRKDEGKGPERHSEKTWMLGWEPPCEAPFHVPSVMQLLCASVPRAPSHPLDTPAEFTSLTRSLLPPQGSLLLGTFEQALGMQFEAELMEEKIVKRGRGKGPHLPGP